MRHFCTDTKNIRMCKFSISYKLLHRKYKFHNKQTIIKCSGTIALLVNGAVTSDMFMPTDSDSIQKTRWIHPFSALLRYDSFTRNRLLSGSQLNELRYTSIWYGNYTILMPIALYIINK